MVAVAAVGVGVICITVGGGLIGDKNAADAGTVERVAISAAAPCRAGVSGRAGSNMLLSTCRTCTQMISAQKQMISVNHGADQWRRVQQCHVQAVHPSSALRGIGGYSPCIQLCLCKHEAMLQRL